MLTKENNKKILNDQKGPDIGEHIVLGLTERGPQKIYRIVNLDLIFLRKDNGRIMSLVKTWEQKNNKKLDEFNQDNQKVLLTFMKATHGMPSIQNLIDSIISSQQREPIVVDCYGTIINGNRRYTAMSEYKISSNSSEVGLDVIILPDDLTDRQIDIIEQKYQFDAGLGPVDYDQLDKALKIRDLVQSGYTIENQVTDHNPSKTKRQRTAIINDYNKIVNILTIVVDRFLEITKRPNDYEYIKGKAWEACLEIYKTYDNKDIKSKYVTEQSRNELLITDLNLLEGNLLNSEAGALNEIYRARKKQYLNNNPAIKQSLT